MKDGATVEKSHVDAPQEGEVRLPLWLRLTGLPIVAPALLIILCALLYVPGLASVPPLDRDEPRFAQATKQMLQSGDYVNIRFQEQGRYKKPIGIYWLQAAAAKLTGYGENAPIWVYRLPSVLGASLAVLLVYWAALAFADRRGAFLSGLLVATSFIVIAEAHLAKADAALLACIVLAQGALARVWKRAVPKVNWWLAFLFWTAMGAGVLLKGPIILMVCGLTIAALCLWQRKGAWVRGLAPVIGLIYLCLLVLPWVVAIEIASEGAFLRKALGGDFLAKIGEGKEAHGAPPLTHLLAGFATFWPLSVFIVYAVPRLWSSRGQEVVSFMLCWLVPSWIVFELVSTKLPHYTMPMLPALAIAVAYCLVGSPQGKTNSFFRGTSVILCAMIPLLLALFVVIGPVYLEIWPSPPGVVLVVCGAFLAFLATQHLRQSQPLKAIPALVVAMAAINFGFWFYSAPALTPLWVSPAIAKVVKDLPHCEETQVFTVGYNEPSLVFLNTLSTQNGNAQQAAAFLRPVSGATDVNAERLCRVAIVEKRYQQAFMEAAKAQNITVKQLGEVSGLKLNGGNKVTLGAFEGG
ncbi:ArnT family glycosyltransferase [Flexibacterium corallicola]|uniref:ArnT family glycosyltransferase n=1 Tax=Flexibacterium corallicola TaxID=3037259 RepID=UPI00286F74C0|nr:glycosyltransferase family 39 protein [Pseudovibrio sp. M1P-2-3]